MASSKPPRASRLGPEPGEFGQPSPQRAGGPRNPGVPLDVHWLAHVRVDGETTAKRAAIFRALPPDPAREVELALRAVRCLDLTTLSPDDTPDRVHRLCATARDPLGPELVETLGSSAAGIRVAAVCVFDRFVPDAAGALADSGIPVAAVTAGFPLPTGRLHHRVAAIEAAVRAGAEEIDVVVTRAHARDGRWRALYREVRAMRGACAAARLKTILGTGELTLREVADASLV